VLCDGAIIEVEHLAGQAAGATPPPAADASGSRAGLRDEIQRMERERITAALAASHGNQSAAAQQLGISRGALLRRMAQLGITHARRSGGDG
jgi:DNA-binding NtrC family response regulator